jgi:CheY-like chemotaxis protein
MLSHELRTPLTPILGWSKVLRTKELPEAKFQEALEAIEHNAKRQAQLVDDLLDLSRIVQGKLSLHLTSVSLIEPIVAALETVRLSAEAKSIHIETKLDVTVEPVAGDPGRLQQVVWNLLSNAIKFTPVNGRITVKLERVKRDAQLTISDTGQGIHPDFLPFVFERFRQEDSSISRQFGGLGLGLSLSRQLVEAHGGTITAHSAGEGRGATFTVRLPLSFVPTPASAKPSLPWVSLQDVRVLVVEDEPSTLRFIVFMLEQEGAIVMAVPSAKAALHALTQARFDVLVSDIGLHEMDGYALLRQIRDPDQSDPLIPEENRCIPAIALTAYAIDSSQQATRAVGYQHHLLKPIEPDDLIQAIAIALKG